MKRTRKGFTLVELLIVIAVLGALSASMSISTKGATASAKAAAIISNVELCKTAAALFYADNYTSKDLSKTTAAAFLTDKKYVPKWDKFSDEDNAIKYTPDTKGKGYDSWAVVVDIKNDTAKSDIIAALKKNYDYKKIDDSATSITVTLTTGDVTFAKK